MPAQSDSGYLHTTLCLALLDGGLVEKHLQMRMNLHERSRVVLPSTLELAILIKISMFSALFTFE